MKIENQVCTFERAKKLKELGITAPSIHLWSKLKFPANDDGDFAKRRGNCLITKTGDSSDRFIMHFIDDEKAAFHWEEGTHDGGQDHSRCELDGDLLPAFTVAELGIMLPLGYHTHTRDFDHNDWLCYDSGNDCIISKSFKTEADARAAMLISLLEGEIVTPEQINQRLLNS